jgi:hypothetical protein
VERLERYIAALRERCGQLPDKRSGRNTRYGMADIGLSAFSVFFMQSPSFLAHQRVRCSLKLASLKDPQRAFRFRRSSAVRR